MKLPTPAEAAAEWDAARNRPRPECVSRLRFGGQARRRETHWWSAPDRHLEPHGIRRQICSRCWCVRLIRRGHRPRYLPEADARAARERRE